MIGPRNVHPDELGDAQGTDLQDAMRVGNRLAESMDDLPMPAAEDFTDRVMAALADEPTPGTTGFLVPLRRMGLAGLPASVRQAWAAVGAGRPILGRGAALAYVLAAVIAGVSLTGAATLGAAGALGLLDPTPTESAPPPAPVPTPMPTAPEPTIAPPVPTPKLAIPTEAPTPSPTATDDEPEGSDDHGGNSGPGGGGDGGDDDSSGSGGNSGPGSSGSDDSGSDDSGSEDSGSDDSGSKDSGDDDSGSKDSGRDDSGIDGSG